MKRIIWLAIIGIAFQLLLNQLPDMNLYHHLVEQSKLMNQRGKHEQAIETASAALDIYRGYDALLEYAAGLSRSGSSKNAKLLLAEAIESSPNRPEAYFQRGCIYFDEGNYLNADFDLSAAISRDRFDETFLMKRATLYLMVKNENFALNDLNALISFAPENGQAYYQRAIAFMQKGDFSKARANFRMAEKLGVREAEEYLKPD